MTPSEQAHSPEAYICMTELERAMGKPVRIPRVDEKSLGLSAVATELLEHAMGRTQVINLLGDLFPHHNVDDFHDAIAGASFHNGRFEPPAVTRPYQSNVRRGI